jgi:biotin synthase
MSPTAVIEAPTADAVRALGQAIIAGHELSAAEARALLEIDDGTPAFDALMETATAVRRHYLGNRVNFCSIVNAKAGNCTENCSYCSQASGSSNDDYSKRKWMDDAEIIAAAEDARANGAKALGLVAAWKGIKEGTQLDMVCETFERLTKAGVIRPDANLGILESQHCADRLREAGVKVYGHNLETARSHFQETCSTHSFEERLKTIQFVKQAGMALCSGGIIGMGETKEQRIEFAEQLRFIEPHMIPINFLNPLQGTAYAGRQPVPTGEALVTLAVFRLFLPDRNLMVAGGKEVTFGDRLHEVFRTGINSVMVGNYLTTLGTSPDYWRTWVPRYGLVGVDETAEASAGGGCGCGSSGSCH